MSPPTHSDLTRPQRDLVIGVITAGFLSALSAFILLVALLYRIFKRPAVETAAIKIFYLWLLFWDVVQGISSILNLRWVLHDEIIIGNYCVSQALVKQLANTGSALSIMAMACCILHDYVIDTSGPHAPWSLRIGIIGIAIISLIQIVDIGLPNGLLHGSHQYYGISGYWCWIASDHFTTKIVTEYLWFWLAWVFSFFTAVVFGISVHKNKLLTVGFLWIGIPLGGGRLVRIGLFSIDNPDKGRFRWSLSFFEMSFRSRTIRLMLPVPVQYLTEVQSDVNRRRINRNTSHAFKLLWFPLAYLVLIAPLSVVRFLGFRNYHVGFRTTIVSGLIFSLSGFVDVLLFNWAKPAFGVQISKGDASPTPPNEIDDFTLATRSIPASKV